MDAIQMDIHDSPLLESQIRIGAAQTAVARLALRQVSPLVVTTATQQPIQRAISRDPLTRHSICFLFG